MDEQYQPTARIQAMTVGYVQGPGGQHTVLYCRDCAVLWQWNASLELVQGPRVYCHHAQDSELVHVLHDSWEERFGA